jgi:hypothetical protein
LAIATEQQPIELILARSLLDSLHTPRCLIAAVERAADA